METSMPVRLFLTLELQADIQLRVDMQRTVFAGTCREERVRVFSAWLRFRYRKWALLRRETGAVLEARARQCAQLHKFLFFMLPDKPSSSRASAPIRVSLTWTGRNTTLLSAQNSLNAKWFCSALRSVSLYRLKPMLYCSAREMDQKYLQNPMFQVLYPIISRNKTSLQSIQAAYRKSRHLFA
jgi:hypothetical protein